MDTNNNTHSLIALDPGFGNTKVCINGVATVIQSAVTRPVEIGLAGSGLKTAESVTRITHGGNTYAVGAGAWRWGDVQSNMDYSSLFTDERLALTYAAIAATVAPDKLTENTTLVVGLPVPLMQDETQMKAIIETAKTLKREHKWSAAQGEYAMTITGVKLLAQPVGAFYDWVFGDDGTVRRLRGSNVGILDLGMNTLDLFAFEDGAMVPARLGGGKHGVRRLLHLSNDDGSDIVEADARLRNGTLKPRIAEVDLWVAEIMGAVERVWPSLKRFSAIVPTGGGAQVLGQRLTDALATKGAAVYWSSDPVTSNVKGLWKKYGKTEATKPQ